jgi:ABC-type phosphate transport system ATPase subunit
MLVGGRRNVLRERAIKEALVEQLRRAGVSLDEVKEWLWEDYGIRVSGGWERVVRIIARDRNIRPQDLVVLMDEIGVQVDEGAWDVSGVARLRGCKDTRGGCKER